MNTWILLRRSVISLPLQRRSLQGFIPGWGGRLRAKGCAKGFQLRSPADGTAPQSFRGGMHISRSQELNSPCGSLLAPLSELENCRQLPAAGSCPPKDKASWLLGCGDQKYRGFRRGSGTFALPSTASLTNYGANSKSITEGLL